MVLSGDPREAISSCRGVSKDPLLLQDLDPVGYVIGDRCISM